MATAPVSEPASPGSTATAETDSVLLVDDNRTNLQVLYQTLHGRDYRVLIARGGEEALGIAEKTHPALILLDIMMPGMDGFEVCRRVKANPATRDAAIIFLSALHESGDKVQGLELGAVDYITKPFEAEEVIARVDTHLRMHRLERDLAVRNRQLQVLNKRILQAMGEGVIGLDRDGRAIFANQAAVSITGWSEQEFLGQQVHGMLRHSDGAGDPLLQSDCGVLATLEQGHVRNADDEVFWRKDGTCVPVDYTSAPVIEDGEVTGAVLVFKDVSERKKAERALAEVHEALVKSHYELQEAQMRLIQAAKLESVGRLAAGVAHEVKNPLAIIQLGLDFLGNVLGDQETAASVVNDMDDAVRRADTVVKGLLDFSRDKKLDLSAGDINQVIESSLTLVQHEMNQRNITLVKELDAVPGFALDHNKLQQVFINLFMNAMQAMDRDGNLEVRSRQRRLSSEDHMLIRETGFAEGDPVIEIKVEDTGPGIAAGKEDKLFDPFFTTKPTGQGTGLGLSVTRNIIKLHNGYISLKNRQECGACAQILFQVAGGEEQ